VTKRRPPRSPQAGDPADQFHLHVARWALLEVMTRDLRVNQGVATWMSTSSGREFLVNLRLAHLASDANEMARLLEAERPVLTGVFTSWLQPLDAPPWLIDMLSQFACRYAWSLLFGSVNPLIFRLDKPLASRKQRLVKGGPDAIRRDVGWFYRAHWKSPADSIGQLSREYVGQQLASGTNIRAARTTVKDGIARAKVWLGT